MKKLSTADQQRIAAFLSGDQVRPLEKSLYRYHFTGGTQADVLAELARFQNANGGFGHEQEPDPRPLDMTVALNPDGSFGQGLQLDPLQSQLAHFQEPKVRLPDMSVIATTMAFRRLREISAPADHPLVVSGCRYLHETYDPVANNWEIISPNVDDVPRAAWSRDGEDRSRRLLSPAAEILGFLYDYPEHFPAQWRQQVTDAVVGNILAAEQINLLELVCVGHLYETPALPQAIRERLFPWVEWIAELLISRDPAVWRGYGLPPLILVTSPASAFAPQFRDEVEANLDSVIERFNHSGYWGPNYWTWGAPSEPQTQAEREWSGVITLNNLVLLRAFGRLEQA